jgi:hypothetical protein
MTCKSSPAAGGVVPMYRAPSRSGDWISWPFGAGKCSGKRRGHGACFVFLIYNFWIVRLFLIDILNYHFSQVPSLVFHGKVKLRRLFLMVMRMGKKIGVLVSESESEPELAVVLSAYNIQNLIDFLNFTASSKSDEWLFINRILAEENLLPYSNDHVARRLGESGVFHTNFVSELSIKRLSCEVPDEWQEGHWAEISLNNLRFVLVTSDKTHYISVRYSGPGFVCEDHIVKNYAVKLSSELFVIPIWAILSIFRAGESLTMTVKGKAVGVYLVAGTMVSFDSRSVTVRIQTHGTNQTIYYCDIETIKTYLTGPWIAQAVQRFDLKKVGNDWYRGDIKIEL